jgi:hypothetical protein
VRGCTGPVHHEHIVWSTLVGPWWVMGAGAMSADRSKPINPPEGKVKNCKTCDKVNVPETCRFGPQLQPGSLGTKGRRLLDDGRVCQTVLANSCNVV